MTGQVLRPYQEQALDGLRAEIRRGHRTLLLVAPTGAGKTTIAAAMIRGAQSKSSSVLFLAHRKELIDQASARLDGCGIDHGIIMADHWRHRPELPVQVASIQTLIRRKLAYKPSIVIVDEAHRSRGDSYQSVIQECGDPILIGLTATPVRSDGRGLGEVFTSMVQCPQIADLIGMGYLVSPRTFAGDPIELKNVKKVAGDYDLAQLANALDKPELIGNIVENWHKHAKGRQTVCFAVNVEHSKHICAQFIASGVKAEHLDGETPKHDREGMLSRLASGETTMVVNCSVLTEGWDCPIVSCAIISRPTMSEGLYLQMAGRALRTNDGKSDCIILDHGGCCFRFGRAQDHRDWELTDDKKKKNAESVDLDEIVKVCPVCGAVLHPLTRSCECGYVFSLEEKEIKHRDGNMIEITDDVMLKVSTEQKRADYEQWLWRQHVERKRNGDVYRNGYAFANYISKYGVKPGTQWRKQWEEKHPDIVREYRHRLEMVAI